MHGVRFADHDEGHGHHDDKYMHLPGQQHFQSVRSEMYSEHHGDEMNEQMGTIHELQVRED